MAMLSITSMTVGGKGVDLTGLLGEDIKVWGMKSSEAELLL